MGMDVGSNSGGVKSDINVTPLVDIVLVLLIIFIVITPAVNDAVALPLSKYAIKQDQENAKYLSLILTRSQERDPVTQLYTVQDVLVDDREAKDSRGLPLRFSFDNTEQRERLIGFVRSNVDRLYVDKRVFIKADADLPFYYINELFQICREAGADEASIITSEDKSDKG